MYMSGEPEGVRPTLDDSSTLPSTDRTDTEGEIIVSGAGFTVKLEANQARSMPSCLPLSLVKQTLATKIDRPRSLNRCRLRGCKVRPRRGAAVLWGEAEGVAFWPSSDCSGIRHGSRHCSLIQRVVFRMKTRSSRHQKRKWMGHAL
jgi:hypothetical protein